MQSERYIVVLLLLPAVFWLVAAGGWIYNIAIVLILVLAALEYGRLYQHTQFRPSLFLLGAGTGLLAVLRGWFGFACVPALTALILVSMVWHLVDYERGASHSGTDFAITLSGILYLGWIGPYLISLRAHEEGLWWLLLVLPCTWISDSAAYVVGRRFGKHHLAPRLSPHKTWEGYAAGVVAGPICGALFAALWQTAAGPETSLTMLNGGLVGLAIAVLSTLGDLGVSMFKRELEVKDSGHLLPGHGGALDRIDSWIWSAVIGFTLIQWFNF